MLEQLPEVSRRTNHIDLIESSHPLLPIILCCLKDRDTERPSADELCRRLASLKEETWYIHEHHVSDNHSLIQQLQHNLEQQTCQLLSCQRELNRVSKNLVAEIEGRRTAEEVWRAQLELEKRNLSSQEQYYRIRSQNEEHTRQELERSLAATEEKLREAIRQRGQEPTRDTPQQRNSVCVCELRGFFFFLALEQHCSGGRGGVVQDLLSVGELDGVDQNLQYLRHFTLQSHNPSFTCMH